MFVKETESLSSAKVISPFEQRVFDELALWHPLTAKEAVAKVWLPCSAWEPSYLQSLY